MKATKALNPSVITFDHKRRKRKKDQIGGGLFWKGKQRQLNYLKMDYQPKKTKKPKMLERQNKKQTPARGR
ncbi:hypothetical protein CIPAW_02G178000 [Carya illinoinensis]|uniref:Uncharacterized protein n=1 Tax=Carya illinoinensis TaxID=32201 RepID=A0A8T1RFT2_CARIL|nr:hypothetical protein CIPAW_02G178000 [Carya illinoinensis]